NPGWATDSGWNLSFSAPLSKSDTTSIATLDSLASGAALKFGVSKFFVKIGQGALAPGYGDIVKAARTKCISMNGSANTPPDDCNASFITDKFIQDYTDEKQYENYIRLFYPDVPAFSLGLQAGAGYKTFDFLDPASGKKGSTDRGSFNLKAFGTLVPWQGVATLTGAITYQHAYKDAMSSTLCPTGSNAAFVQCATGAIGRPKSDDSYQASLEFRKQFALAKGPVHNLGFSLQVTRDFNQKVTGIDLPVYLVSDEKGNLIGGMRFGYTSDKHDLIVGVFAGSNFSVF
ncbi:MAG: hypothetical protein ACXWKR_16300, partial [Phenylobacterium sp.]